MFHRAFKVVFIFLHILTFVNFVHASECMTDELTSRVEAALGSSSRIFTNGRYVEVDVLNRRMLKLVDELDPGTPRYIDGSVNEGIRDKIEIGGYTNLDLMLEGKAPIGTDGKQINLHHLFGEEPGPMAEIEATIHQREHGVLHKMIKESFRRDPALEVMYEEFKKKYWKERAKDFMG